jgi:hypothetical protein
MPDMDPRLKTRMDYGLHPLTATSFNSTLDFDLRAASCKSCEPSCSKRKSCAKKIRAYIADPKIGTTSAKNCIEEADNTSDNCAIPPRQETTIFGNVVSAVSGTADAITGKGWLRYGGKKSKKAKSSKASKKKNRKSKKSKK